MCESLFSSTIANAEIRTNKFAVSRMFERQKRMVRKSANRATYGILTMRSTYPEPRPNPTSTATSERDRHDQPLANNSRSASVEDDNVEVGLHKSKKETRPAFSRYKSGSSTSHAQTRNSAGHSANMQTANRHFDAQVRVEQSLSPSTENSSTPASAGLEQSQELSSASTNASNEALSWSHLPVDIQYYLNYHQKYITHHHYFFKHSAEGLLRTILFEQALLYEPLLYAVVGFAAFHLAVKRQSGRIQDFLGYYDKSVSLLRKSLAGGQKYTDATFLTTLQLATFEVSQAEPDAMFVLLDEMHLHPTGVPWGLRQSPWSSAGCLPHVAGALHARHDND